MNNPRRFRPLRRIVETTSPKVKIVLYSEGEKTERDYFEALRRFYQNTLVDIEIVAGAGVPLTIAKLATEAAISTRRRSKRQSYAKRDEFWAIFDRDDHPHVSEAISRCNDADVGVAFSDPCFELWLILHFQNFDRPDHRHDVQKHLETLCKDYDHLKRKTTDCDKLMGRVTEAEDRAEQQLGRRKDEGEPPGPPFTTVYNLTRRIRAG